MILIENRELLIPNNERYIGTTQDALSENRVFRIRRVSQSGVDMANLTFRLDLKYPEGRKVYSFDASTSRTNRIVQVNAQKWAKQFAEAGAYIFSYNGTSWTYQGQAVSLSEAGVAIYFTPLTGDTITVVVQITQAQGDTVLLDKEVTDDYINLTWNITAAQLTAPGGMLISVRATDEESLVRWASFQATIFVEKNGYTASDYDGKLSELEQLENAISQDIESIENAAQQATSHVEDSEAWAKGSRNGSEVADDDETYRNNSKYYAGQAESSADAAAGSEANARNSENNASTSMNSALSAADSSATSAAKSAGSAAESQTAAGLAGMYCNEAQTLAKDAVIIEDDGLFYMVDGEPEGGDTSDTVNTIVEAVKAAVGSVPTFQLVGTDLYITYDTTETTTESGS